MRIHSKFNTLNLLRLYVHIASIILVIVGLAVLIGWFLDIDFLKSIFLTAATMKFNTALGFLCAGISLWFLKNENGSLNEQRIGQVFAGLIFLIGFLTLGEHIFGWDLGIDQLFIKDPDTAVTSFPGRLSFITALCFSLSGMALLLIGSRVSQYASALVFLLALLALVGYLFDYQSLYRISGYGSVALHTALTLLILSLAIPAARPSLGIMKVVTSDLSGGRTIRLFLPTVVFLTIFMGWLIKQAQQQGFLDVQNDMVVLIVLIVVLYSPFIYLYGKQIDVAEGQIIRLSRFYATLSQVNQAIVRVKDEETLYQTICDVVIQFGKFRLAWIGILDESTGDVNVAAINGAGAEFVESLNSNINRPPFDTGLIGLALRNGTIFASDNIQIDERMKHWREPASKYEYRSAVAIPLRLRGKTMGLLNLHASETGFFQREDEVLLLEEIGGDISFALDMMETEKERKRAEDELEKLNAELEKRVVERTTQLEALNKELESFSYSVSHDLRAPLRSIDGFSQALLDEEGDQLSEEGRSHLARVRKSAQRMAELIDDMLNLARITRAPIGSGPVDLSSLAFEILTSLQESQPERKVKFLITPGLTIQGDSNLLRIVLENLLNNAFKFTSKRDVAEIEFGSRNENGEVIYFVRDNGAGFNMANAGRLFGAFQRLHSANEFEGTGVGLATVQRIIQRHGGRIWVESAVDKGTIFQFTL